MYTFVGKVSPFLIISALTLLNLGERLSTERRLLHCLPVPQRTHVLWSPYISVVLGCPGNVDWIHYKSERTPPPSSSVSRLWILNILIRLLLQL